MSTTWLCLVYSLSFLLGLFARPALDQAGLTTMDAERVYFLVAEHFFPAIIAGLLLTAVIAAVMSTADSQLLLSSAIAAGDLPLLRRFASSVSTSQRVWLGRGLLLVIGALAAFLAIAFPDSVLNLVAYAWGGMGATFGPAVILALYLRRFNLGGAIAGVVVGFAVATLWQFVLSGGPQGMFDVMPAMPGFVAGTVAASRCHTAYHSASRGPHAGVRPGGWRETGAGVSPEAGVAPALHALLRRAWDADCLRS